MPIDWDDNTKRKSLREALQKVYPSDAELAMFVDEELNVNLATIAGGANLQVTAHGLVSWARAQGRLDEVYEAFKAQNPSHSAIKNLEPQPLLSLSFNLSEDDWNALFDLFFLDDFADLRRAFLRSFQEVNGIAFQEVQPDYAPLVELIQIRELLKRQDRKPKKPVLSIRFVECAIDEIRRSSEGNNRDLTALEQWRDRIAQQYNVPPKSPTPDTPVTCNAYLLVALKEMGPKVNVYPELHITGADNPIPFGATPTTCAVSQVANQIFEWIKQAEATEEIQQCESPQVVLELFLPYQLLEVDIATDWKVKDDEWEDERELGTYRRFLVRSSERLRPKFQNALARKWKRLEQAVNEGNGCSGFRRQDSYLKRGELTALLDDLDATGLKLTARLPADSSKRHDVFKDIIEASIPIALWSSDTTETDPDTLKAEFDALLKQVTLINFADLAKRWRMRRIDSALSKHIKLLCDCPHRSPDLPNPTQEEDLLVAS